MSKAEHLTSFWYRNDTEMAYYEPTYARPTSSNARS